MPLNRDDSYIEHFGVKGMKWGVRRKRTSVSKKEAKAQVKTAVAKEKREQAKKTAASLSDAELRTKLNRLNMEKQYVNLVAPKATPKTTKTKSKGQNSALKVIAKAGGSAVGKYAGQEIFAQMTKVRPTTKPSDSIDRPGILRRS